MEFKDLHSQVTEFVANRVKDGKRPAVSVSWLRELIQDNVAWVNCINFYPIKELDLDDYPFGMMKTFADQDAAYNNKGAWMVAVYENTDRIKENFCWQRFVRCKEMMHIFDKDAEWVERQEQYTDLLKEIATRPLGDKSPQLLSEHLAQWKAILILCPLEERNKVVASNDTDYAVALRYRIPMHYIEAIRSDSYMDAYTMFAV